MHKPRFQPVLKNPVKPKAKRSGDLQDNPWSYLDHRPIYENPWMCVTEYDLLNPVGNPAKYTIISPKNHAIGIIPFDGENVYLVGQYRVATQCYSWEIPEGGCPEGDTPIQAARRELAEETGLRASAITALFNMHLSNSITDEVASVFLATGLSQGEASPEETEILQVKKVPLAALLDAVDSGEITDAMTVASAYKLALMRARGDL